MTGDFMNDETIIFYYLLIATHILSIMFVVTVAKAEIKSRGNGDLTI